jgi:hypothetical protein
MPKFIEFGFTNLNETLQKLSKLGDRANFELSKALFQEAEKVMAVSKEYVPVDTGALRSSGHVQQPSVNGNVAEVTMSYGGPSVDYAVIVHEDLNAHHPHGVSKYLETPLNAALPQLDENLSKALQTAIDTTMG